MPTDARPRDFDLVSFDCYGTLIDWESGILAAMQPVISRHELFSSADDVLQAYARAESAVQAGAYRPYREVLRRTFAAMAKDLGFAPQADELETLVEALPRWEPFHDTIAGLRALRAAGHRLAIISNDDDDLFAATTRALVFDVDAVVTAAMTRCYNPSPDILERAFEVFGLPPQRILHAAQSRFHDIVPARRLGMQTVHVVRDSGRASAVPDPDPATAPASDPATAPSTAPATAPSGDPSALEADWSVPDLAGLVTLLGA
mgnify:CR=1 FL=1